MYNYIYTEDMCSSWSKEALWALLNETQQEQQNYRLKNNCTTKRWVSMTNNASNEFLKKFRTSVFLLTSLTDYAKS